ncbi:MAG TPA: gamma-glutamylcyclotransferase [Stellaceae bacterium]|nr:gamma-glutamylcyclotransferase [Stellaceae bacterium]
MSKKPVVALTRESILDGSMHRWIALADPTMKLMTDEERRVSIAETLAARPGPSGDVWVFAYGSLIWNPTIESTERRPASLRGYHRRFCLWTHLGRGSQDCPGLMLALERGGSCSGVAYRLAPEHVERELMILWRREMLSGAYHARWVRLNSAQGRFPAIAFVMNTDHDRYAGRLSQAEVAAVIARAEGALGPCWHYLFSTVEHLLEEGLRDRRLEGLADEVMRLQQSSSAPSAAGAGG